MPHTELTSPLAVLVSRASKAAFEKALERAGITQEDVLILLLAKQINPALVLTEAEEAIIRRIGRDTLRGYKNDGIVPPVL